MPASARLLVVIISWYCVCVESLLFVLRTFGSAGVNWEVSPWVVGMGGKQRLQYSFLPSLVLFWSDPLVTLRDGFDLLHFVVELLFIMLSLG